MKFEVAIALGDKIVDIVVVEDVHQVIVSEDVYYLKGEQGKPVFTSPLAKTAYVKKVD